MVLAERGELATGDIGCRGLLVAGTMRVVTSGVPDLLRHYNVDADEDGRLRRSAHGRSEFLRTQELPRRFLPASLARIVDVGGGTGVRARWLAAVGGAVGGNQRSPSGTK